MGNEIRFNLIAGIIMILFGCLQVDSESECVHDKAYCINGESSRKSPCIPWAQSTKYKSVNIFLNTTLCEKHKTYYWCATSVSWNDCQPSRCELSYDLCKDGISWETFEKSVKLKIPNKFDTVTILQKSESECAISAQCRMCRSVEQMIGNLFNGCQLLEVSRDHTRSISFPNLRHSTKYHFYILPIQEGRLMGFVFKLNLLTKISKPCLPYSIKSVKREFNSILFEWIECKENATFGRTSGYSLAVSGHSTKSFNTTKTSWEMNQLSPCKQYCIRISAYNDAGYSHQSESICTFTRPSFDEVKAVRITKTLPLIRMIEWDYENKHICPVTFQVRLFMDKAESHIGYFITVDKFIKFDNLIRSKIYFVQITPEFQNETGPRSPLLRFHTFQKPSHPGKITVKEKQQTSFRIEWERPLSNDLFGEPDGYQITIDNLFDQIFNTTKTNYYITDLATCTKYCISIHTYNLAGKSHQPQKTCIYTKIERFDHIIMKPLEMNQTLPVTVKWTYENSLKCEDISFEVTYYKENDYGSLRRVTTRSHSASLDYIEPLKRYKCTVRPKYQGEFGDYSNDVEIYINDGKTSKTKFLFLLIILPCLIFALIAGWFFKTRVINKPSLTKNLTSNLLPETEIMNLKRTEGNERIFDIKNSIKYSRVDSIESNKNESKNLEQFTKEFKDLALRARKYEKLNNYTTFVGESEKNKSKNRFVNILPYDQTRVVLQNNSKKNDYINANYIPFVEKRDKYEFIASQGPIQNSISDFWDMIWENNVTMIVMLTRTYEEDKFKCLQYWPESKGKTVKFGENQEYEVSMEEELKENSFLERKLEVLNKNSNEQRSIIHLQMIEWNDYSAPKFEDFEFLLFRFQDIILRADYHPILIHCSAGVGRTGTFIVLDRIIRKMMQGNLDIIINDEILEIRKYRKMMVQRVVQFIFIRDFVSYFLHKYSQQDENNNEENLYFNS